MLTLILSYLTYLVSKQNVLQKVSLFINKKL